MSKQIPHSPLDGERPELKIDLHDGTEEQISIIVVHKDRPEYLNICIQSIAIASVNNNYEIIVVDNGSGKESQEFLDEIEGEIKVIRNKKNLYWSAAANKGVEAADKNSKYYIFLHCDTVVLNPVWIDVLVNVSQSQNCGLVGLEINSYFLQGQKVDFIPEWCMLVTKECWKDVGGFPEDLPQIGHSFIFTRKASIAGHKPQVMKNPIVHHYRVFSLDINEYEQLSEKAMVTIPKYLRDDNSVALV